MQIGLITGPATRASTAASARDSEDEVLTCEANLLQGVRLVAIRDHDRAVA